MVTPTGEFACSMIPHPVELRGDATIAEYSGGFRRVLSGRRRRAAATDRADVELNSV